MVQHIRYKLAMASVVGGSAVPYGYTLVIWTSGAALERRHGTPQLTQGYLFIVGAVAAFAFLAAVVRRVRPEPSTDRQTELLVTGAVQFIAVGIAFTSATVVSRLHSAAAWPLGAFTATLLYLTVAALELRSAKEAQDSQK
jgi:predicted permease